MGESTLLDLMAPPQSQRSQSWVVVFNTETQTWEPEMTTEAGMEIGDGDGW
ncbi:hypothetical protein Bca4012_027290 [Brassica carinata]